VKVLIAGSSGLVGSALKRALIARDYQVIEVNSKIVDLTDRAATFEFVGHNRPEIIIDAAAKVGGIGANNEFPVDFLSKNLQIQTNLMDAAHQFSVQDFVFLGSSCIYPKNAPQPIKEEYLLTGPLEETNSAYAIAKIAGIELIKSYRKQFGYKWISIMPTNLYGPGDNFDLATSHVLPALINRFVTAKNQGLSSVTLWGSGKPKREFLHVDDLAQAILQVLGKYNDDLHLNVGTGRDISINELATMIAKFSDFEGEILWDRSKPDGTPRKVLDVSRIESLGWSPKIELSEGIQETISWFKKSRSLT
jgi:GDP-L-fucose synthase